MKQYPAAGSTATDRKLARCDAVVLLAITVHALLRSAQTMICLRATSSMYRFLVSQSTAIALTADTPCTVMHATHKASYRH